MRDFKQINSEINYLIRNKNYTKALKIIDDYLNEEYDPYLVVSKAHILIVTSTDNDSLEEIKDMLEHVLSDYSISFATKKYALTELARIASVRRDNEGALKYFQQILDSSNYLEPNIRCKMSKIYINCEKYDEALKMLETGSFNNEGMNVRRCHAYLMQKKYKEAFDALSRPIQDDSRSRDAKGSKNGKVENEKNFYLGCIYHSYFNDLDEAMRYYNEVVQNSDVEDNFYWSSIGGIISVHYSSYELDKCRELCRFYLEKAPTNLKSYDKIVKTLIKTYIEVRDYNKALELAIKYNANDLKDYINACKMISDFDFIPAYQCLDKIESSDEGLNYDILFKKLTIMYRLNRVEEFDKLFNEVINKATRSKYMQVEARCMKAILYRKNNLRYVVPLDTYYTQQIKNYSEDRLRDYILDNYSSCFNGITTGADLNNLFEDLKKQIEVMTPICDGLYDLYIVAYHNISVSKNGEAIHYLTVKCLPDTKDIITILPLEFNKKEYDDNIIPSQKGKRLSQIEKFNKRYGN